MFYRTWTSYTKDVCLGKNVNCNTSKLPRKYIAYHLNGKTVNIDGQLNEEAWAEVPWTKPLVDMRASWYPKPRFETKFKVRWDDTKLYVGAYVQDKDLWGTVNISDTAVWKDNGIEILMDVDGTMFNYKQIQVNVLGTIFDLLFYGSPWDKGGWVLNKTYTHTWSAGVTHAVYTSGTVNRPLDVDKFWSVEFSFTFDALAQNSTRTTPSPQNGEVWFMQFGRGYWKLNITSDGQYVKTSTVDYPEDWWSWQPCGAINLHLQDRWGLVQFKRSLMDKKFLFNKWHIYRALFEMLDAMKKYKAINGKYTSDIQQLQVPYYLFSRACVEIPTIKLVTRNGTKDFEVTVTSRLITQPPGHIRSDKYVWFQ